MVSELDDEDGLPQINLRKKRKFNNLQWKQENGSFNFSMKQAPTDRIDAKNLFSQRRPEKIGASEYEIFSLIFKKVITQLVTETNRYAQQRND